jgi:hypothetical protein
MYEKYFREFVAFLFPNDLLDVSILDFIEGEQTLEGAREYGKKNGVNLLEDYNAAWVVLNLSLILGEMKKDQKESPKKDLINYHLGKIMDVLKNFNAPNIDNFESFQTFLLLAKAKDESSDFYSDLHDQEPYPENTEVAELEDFVNRIKL